MLLTCSQEMKSWSARPWPHLLCQQHVLRAGASLLKAYGKGTRKDPKTFTLRDVCTAAISSCAQLKREIQSQLKDDIIKGDFDVGFMQASTLVSMRSTHDL